VEILVTVSASNFFSITHLLHPGPVDEVGPIWQHCQTLGHKCYGLATKFAAVPMQQEDMQILSGG